MNALLDQLGLNYTFLIEFALFAALFLLLSEVYFKPFLKLFELRHKKTVEDREAAEKLMTQAQAKFDEYKRLLTEERVLSKKSFEATLQEARKQEAELLSQARDEAKKITQEAADSVNRQRDQIKKQLEADVTQLAQNISERLLARKM